jgi:hypothetical protein
MMTAEDYKQKALDALAVGGGGADEALLGAPSTVSSGFNDFLKAHPKAATTGRVGSYLIPFLGEEEAAGNALVRGGKMALKTGPANALGHLVSGAVSNIPGLAARAGESFFPGLGRAALRGGATALGVHAATGLAKDALGTADPNQDIAGSAVAPTAIGTLLGMVGHGAQAAAPYVYNHPAFINPAKMEASESTANEMLGKGMMGSLKKTFLPYADQVQEQGVSGIDSSLKNAIRNEQQAADAARPDYPYGSDPRGMTPVEDFKNVGRTQGRNMRSEGGSPSKQKAMNDAFNSAADELNPDFKGNTSLYDFNQKAKIVNTRIQKGFSGADKGKAFGSLDGSLAAEKERALALQKGYNDTIEGGIDQFGEDGDLDKYGAARKVYRKGADLEDNINNYNSDSAGGEAHTRHLGNRIADATINSAPIRTGAGVAMSRMDPSGMARVGSQTYGAMSHPSQVNDQSFQDFLKQHKDSEQNQSGGGGASNPFEDDYLPNHAAAPKSTPAPARAGSNPFEEGLSQ